MFFMRNLVLVDGGHSEISRTGLPLSKLNKTFFRYFDPEDLFLDAEN